MVDLRSQYDEFTIDEARRGNPGPLIGRFRASLGAGNPLTANQIQFIIEVLEARAGKRYGGHLREAERALIVMQIDRLTEEGKSKKEAVGEMIDKYGRSRRHIFGALRAARELEEKHGKSHRYIFGTPDAVADKEVKKK